MRKLFFSSVLPGKRGTSFCPPSCMVSMFFEVTSNGVRANKGPMDCLQLCRMVPWCFMTIGSFHQPYISVLYGRCYQWLILARPSDVSLYQLLLLYDPLDGCMKDPEPSAQLALAAPFSYKCCDFDTLLESQTPS